VVAVASSGVRDDVAATRSQVGWIAATGLVIVVGVVVRLALGGGGVGDRSAAIMTVLLSLVAWVATLLLSTPRAAFLVTLGLVALLDVAALPQRNLPEYDDREAFFRTDQVITAQLPVVAGPAVVTLLAEPVFAGDAPKFGLAGDIGGAQLAWDCAFQRGIHQIALPLPPTLAGGDARLQLTGSPSRESDYLLVYLSSRRGGFLISSVSASELSQSATTCTLLALAEEGGEGVEDSFGDL
jgi:hypothetical protein